MKKFVFNISAYSIRLYQLCLSPFLPNSCRFYPSCSSFALVAIKKYGLFRGSLFSARRIVSCHPFNKKSNYDPVP